MAKVEVGFFPDLKTEPPFGPDLEIETGPLEVIVLAKPDISDPFNECLVVSFKVGQRCGGRAMVSLGGLATAIAGLILVVLDNAAVIRDAIAEENAEHGKA